MCILFCLCNTCLFQSISSKELTKCIGNLFFYKRNQLVRNGHIILCKTNICGVDSFSTIKSVKCIITECSCNLSCTIRTEIKEDHRIVIFDRSYRNSIFLYNSRKYKFIRYILIIRSLNAFCSTCSLLTFTKYECTVCFFYSIPSVVTVHYIITSHNRCHFTNADFCHPSFKFSYVFFTRCRWCVTTIKEAVYIYFLDTLTLGQFQESVNV